MRELIDEVFNSTPRVLMRFSPPLYAYVFYIRQADLVSRNFDLRDWSRESDNWTTRRYYTRIAYGSFVTYADTRVTACIRFSER